MQCAIITHHYTEFDDYESSERTENVLVLIPHSGESDTDFTMRIRARIASMKSEQISGFGITRPLYEGFLDYDFVDME